MSSAVASSAAVARHAPSRLSFKSSSVGGCAKAFSAVRGARSVTAPCRSGRAMTVQTKASSINLLGDDDKKPLVDSVETFIFDCDGVIWKGDSLIEGVPETIAMLREMGKRLIFVTNNSTAGGGGGPGRRSSTCTTERPWH